MRRSTVFTVTPLLPATKRLTMLCDTPASRAIREMDRASLRIASLTAVVALLAIADSLR